MRHSLAAALRLARLAKQAACRGQHGRTGVSFLQTADPDPDPPPLAEPCAYGAIVTVSHVIHRLIQELPDNWSSRT